MKNLVALFFILPVVTFSNSLPSKVECRIYWGEGGNSETGGGSSYRNSFVLEKMDDEDIYTLFYVFGANSYLLATELNCRFSPSNPSIYTCDQLFSNTKNCVKVIADGWKRIVLPKKSCTEPIAVTIKTHEFIQTNSLQSGGCFAIR